MNLSKRISILALVSFTCVGCDQTTKVLAAKFLPRNDMLSYFFDSIRLGYAENTGAFLSLGSSLPPEYRFWILTVATGAIVSGLLLYLIVNSNFGRIEFVGYSLFFAGGASNIFDRATNNGAVVDFLNIGIGPIRTGIFNIADVVMMIALVAIVYSQYKLGGRANNF
jgi:signal peptidase II